MMVQEGVGGVLQRRYAAGESYNLPHRGAPVLVSQQTRAARASHPAATAQAQPSSTSCCRSKSAVCCDNTEVGGFIGAQGLGSRRCAASETATVSEELRCGGFSVLLAHSLTAEGQSLTGSFAGISWMSLTVEPLGTQVAQRVAVVGAGRVDGGRPDVSCRRECRLGQGGAHRAGVLWGRLPGDLHAWCHPGAPSAGRSVQPVRRGIEPLRAVVH